MKKGSMEMGVGVFVLLGLICIAYLTVKLGKMEWLDNDVYRVNAKFATVTGLKEGAMVEIAGVQVGKVETITLDPKNMVARVVMKIRNGVELDDETIAAVKTSGLIGDKYVRLQPGGGLNMLQDGGQITETQSAVDMEELVGKYAFGEVKQ
ncbi:MAG TPA: outer membrane lipid asymmetry maintenance protein MlaD [Candidatus Hydrogenedentes bacterium]|nr:outer membrane lipid asymmetry maintenance protein MlaD [Candidatus Hydrogenedentota bacterium]